MRSVTRRFVGPAAITAVLALAACSAPSSSDDPPSSLRIAVTGLDLNFDPFAFAEIVSPGPVMASYDPLISWDRSSETFDPWLAEEFSVSDDGLTLTMKLREDVDFIDGEHFDAEALKTYFDATANDPETGPGANLGPYEPTVNVTGAYTLDIVTTKPMRFDFFYLLEEVPIASPSVVENRGAALEEPVGSGPYLVEEIVPDVSATMVRNPEYWNPEAYPFDELEFIVFADEVAALNALTSGQIDATMLNVQLAVQAEEAGFVLHEGVGSFPTLYFQDRGGLLAPPIGDVRVRQAINMAFDRAQIAESLDLGFGTVSSQPYTPGQPEYIEGGDDYYVYDPERAKELLAEAGYPDGFDLDIIGGGGSAFTATAPFEPIIQQSLADIGIRVTFHKFADVGEWFEEIKNARWPVLAIPHIYTNVTRLIDHTGDAWFLPGGRDPVIDPIIEKINFGNAEEFVEGSQELGRYLLENAWFAPFSKPPTIWATIAGIDIEVGQILGIPNLREFQRE